jgi:nucleoid-associated protein YgaU
MKQRIISTVLCLLLTFSLSACTVRAYKMQRERLDQDLTGNRGYLSGSVTEVSQDRKTHRTTQVVEVEFAPFSFWKKKAKKSEKPLYAPARENEIIIQGNRGYIQGGPSQKAPDLEAESISLTIEKYTVKKGDTLQKISKKYFGTTKKWLSIYQVNRDALKGPDSIYPGQVINIPLEALKEPQENLK